MTRRIIHDDKHLLRDGAQARLGGATTNHERGRRWYRYAVYANRLLVLVTADRLEAEVRYSRCKMDDTCMRVTLCGVKRGQAIPQTLEVSPC